MKKFLSLFLSVVILFGMTVDIGVSAYAGTVYVNGDYEYGIHLNEYSCWRAHITKYKGNEKNLTIPKELGDYIVEGISSEAFYECNNLISVDIPHTVTSISDSAFCMCPNLSKVTLGKNVKWFGKNSVIACEKFSNIYVDFDNDYFSSINGVLYDKEKNKLINYPNGNKRKSYTIPNGIKEISYQAFKDACNLEKIIIPNGLEDIRYGAFYNCSNLYSINIPDSINKIESFAFKETAYYNNKSNWENDVLYIDNCLLNVLTSIKPQCIIKDGTKLIAEEAFTYCFDLKTIVFPDSIKLIPKNTIIACGVENIIIPKSIETISYNAILDYRDLSSSVYECSLKNVFYGGSEEEYNKINFEKGDYPNEECNNYFDILKTYIRFNSPCAKKHHNVSIKDAIVPTCTKSGKTEGRFCSSCGVILKEQQSIKNTGHTYKKVVTKATLSKNGSSVNKCSVCGAKKSSTTIYYPKTIKLSKGTFVYNGKVQKPSVTVKDCKGNTLKLNKDYTVSYSNASSKNVGKYTVTIKFKGNYTGTKTIGYRINPKPTEFIPSNKGGFKAIKNGFTLKWNKQASQTTGYQIQYATKRDFSNAATITIANPNTTSKTIKGRAGNTRYYVRVRTYKKIGSGTFYSSWNSGVKSVVTLR